MMNWALWIIAAVVAWKVYSGMMNSTQRIWKRANEEALADFGQTVDQRAKAIDAAFDQRQMTIKLRHRIPKTKLEIHIGRSLAAMPAREREALRISYHLLNMGLQQWNNAYIARTSLVYGDGQAIVYEQKGVVGEQRGAMTPFKAEVAVNILMQDLMAALQKNPNDPLVKRLRSRIMGDGGELAPGPPLESAARGGERPAALYLGLDEGPGDEWYYEGEGSLITIAPTRCGKTQSQVLPNLLRWKGPAVILDIKEELYQQTSKWRKQNVGPVYKFSPLDAARSHSFNPLSVIRSDPQFIWQDARTLADLMIVPSGSGEGNAKFFEGKARDVLQAAIAFVCIDNPPDQRPLSKVIDIIHGMGWKEFVAYLQARVDISAMARAGHALATTLDPKTRDSVLQTAQESLSAWSSDSIERTTGRSDWHPLDLRTSNATIYICVRPSEIASYLSVLRVIIGLHIRALANELPPHGSPQILFMLDEMPQLRFMPPVAEALVVGAGYGIKLWMFAQDLGQLKEAYPNADGMMQNCAVRMYMNPDLQDGTAQKLSEDIGYRDSIIDGQRVKIIEPNVLAGPDFKDFIIVMSRGGKPCRLKKNFAWQDPFITARMGSL
jgi:type IV secretion system protein VirD4